MVRGRRPDPAGHAGFDRDRVQKLIEQGDLDGALTALASAAQENPAAALGEVSLLIDVGRHPEATRKVDLLARTWPELWQARYLQGVLALSRGRWSRARRAFRRAVRLEPGAAAAWLALGNLELQAGRWEDVLVAAESARRIDAGDEEARMLRAWALVGLGRHGEVDHATWDALNGSSADVGAYLVRGWAALHQGRREQAQQNFQRALEASPGHGMARAGLVESLKARHWPYAWVLRVDLWMARNRRLARFAVMFAFLFVLGMVLNGAEMLGGGENTIVYGVAVAIVSVVFWFALLMYVAGSRIFAFRLRFDRGAQEVLAAVDRSAQEYLTHLRDAANRGDP